MMTRAEKYAHTHRPFTWLVNRLPKKTWAIIGTHVFFLLAYRPD